MTRPFYGSIMKGNVYNGFVCLWCGVVCVHACMCAHIHYFLMDVTQCHSVAVT
jgi:hypothetical protein